MLLDNIPFIKFLPLTAFSPQSFIIPLPKKLLKFILISGPHLEEPSGRSMDRETQAEIGDVGRGYTTGHLEGFGKNFESILTATGSN